jgi:hypothetical protein
MGARRQFDSRAEVIVLRPEHGRWLAWLGVGQRAEPVANPAAIPRRRAGSRGQKESGAYAFVHRASAHAEAMSLWASLYGSTRPAPRVLVLAEGQNAWQAFRASQRASAQVEQR